MLLAVAAAVAAVAAAVAAGALVRGLACLPRSAATLSPSRGPATRGTYSNSEPSNLNANTYPNMLQLKPMAVPNLWDYLVDWELIVY